MVLYCLVLVSVLLMFYLMCVLIVLIRSRLLSSHRLFGMSCSLGLPDICSLCFSLCLFDILVGFHFGFEGRTLALIAPLPGHCLRFPFYLLTLTHSLYNICATHVQ